MARQEDVTGSTGEPSLPRARTDPAYRQRLLKLALTGILSAGTQEHDAGKYRLHEYIRATIGYEALASALALTPRHLSRILSARPRGFRRFLDPGFGDPRLSEFSPLLELLCKHEGISLFDDA